MESNMINPFEKLSDEEKKIELYLSQKRLLDTFLERNAISKAQYEKSLNDLTAKMHMESVLGGNNK